MMSRCNRNRKEVLNMSGEDVWRTRGRRFTKRFEGMRWRHMWQKDGNINRSRKRHGARKVSVIDYCLVR